jgi:hypothetical protein
VVSFAKTHLQPPTRPCTGLKGECAPSGSKFVVKFTWQTEERKNFEREAYSAVEGQFGIPDGIVAFQVVDSNNVPISNLDLLPGSDAKMRPLMGHEYRPAWPERRWLVAVMFKHRGNQLTHCKTGKELATAMMHAELSKNRGGVL